MADYKKLVDALRCELHYTSCPETNCKYICHDTFCDTYRLMLDAAAAIEALQADMKTYGDTAFKEGYEMGFAAGEARAEKRMEPKRGEWQKAKPKGVVTYSDGYAECSHCHEAIWLGWGMNFCPNCGTQNRIIDPDDYDGAKMEVQE